MGFLHGKRIKIRGCTFKNGPFCRQKFVIAVGLLSGPVVSPANSYFDMSPRRSPPQKLRIRLKGRNKTKSSGYLGGSKKVFPGFFC